MTKFHEGWIKTVPSKVYKSFACSKFRYDTFQKVNNKGADQTAGMRRLVCPFVFGKPEDTFFRAEAHFTVNSAA